VIKRRTEDGTTSVFVGSTSSFPSRTTSGFEDECPEPFLGSFASEPPRHRLRRIVLAHDGETEIGGFARRAEHDSPQATLGEDSKAELWRGTGTVPTRQRLNPPVVIEDHDRRFSPGLDRFGWVDHDGRHVLVVRREDVLDRLPAQALLRRAVRHA
jgi:hypothetical protein